MTITATMGTRSTNEMRKNHTLRSFNAVGYGLFAMYGMVLQLVLNRLHNRIQNRLLYYITSIYTN